MALRRLVWTLPLAAALVAVSSISSAGAVGAFGPAQVALPSCGTGLGDAGVAGNGTVRGFAECDADPYGQIHFFKQAPATPVARETSPYVGTVLSSAWDGVSATFVLYEQDDTLKLGKRSEDGTYAPAQTLSTTGATYSFYSGDLVASNGRWYAVWSEQVGPGENAHFQLFEARTLGGTKGRTRLSNTPGNVSDGEPTLTLVNGVPVIAWSRMTVGSQSVSSDIWIGNNRGGVWSTRVFAAVGFVNYSPNVFGYAGTVFVTWVRDSQVMEADNPGGVWRSTAFHTPGQYPYVGASMGKTWVTWSAGLSDSESRVFLAERNASTWSGSYLTYGNAAPLAVTGQGGKARVLFRTPNDVFIRTES